VVHKVNKVALASQLILGVVSTHLCNLSPFNTITHDMLKRNGSCPWHNTV